MEQLIIDYSLRKKDDPKKYSPSTGKEISNLWENLEKYLGIYWFTLLKIKEENKNKEIIIKNLDLNFIPLAVYFDFKIDLETIKFEENNVLNYISPQLLYDWSIKAKEENNLRDLIEMISCSSVKLSDILYQLDFTGKTQDIIPPTKNIYQNSWQSYGRHYIREFHKKILKDKEHKNKCILLPCTKGRPYYSKGSVCAFSKKTEFNQYFNDNSYEKVVISNIGIVPEKYWKEELILKYVAGVPDLGRIYQLCREFFTRNKFKEIICFLEYPPYIEIMEILEKFLNLNIKYFIKKKYRIKGAKFAIHNLI